MRILCLGDIVGNSARRALKKSLAGIRAERQIDIVIANGENAAGGVGLDPERAEELHSYGVDVITLGDHTWQRRPLQEFLRKKQENVYCIRPANYPGQAPGQGWTTVVMSDGRTLGVINLLGRVFFNTPLDCPFRAVDALLDVPLRDAGLIICDMHAEATSEKVAMGRYLDGRAALVFGTHTHVQTADEQILNGGTGYITDLGMCGPKDGIIGMDAKTALQRFLTGMGQGYNLAQGPAVLQGVVAELDWESRRCRGIERFWREVGEED